MSTPNVNSLLKYLTFSVRLFSVLIVVILCVLSSYYVLKYAYPFVIAFLVTISINPLVIWVQEKLKCPRTLAVFIIMIGIFGSAASIISLFTLEMIDGLSFIIARIPNHISTIMGYLNDFTIHRLAPFWEKTLHIFYSLNPSQQNLVQDNLHGITQEMTSFISNLGTGLLTGLTKIILYLPNAFTIMIVILLSTFFMCKDWYNISHQMQSKLTKNLHATFLQIYHELREAISGYIRAQCALMSITCAVMIFSLSILHVDHALTISILTAMIDFLPYIGTGVVLIPWSFYSLLTGQSFFALLLVFLYLLLVAIRQILEPKLLATSIGLNPLATLIVVFVGFNLFGLLGLFIGPGSLVLLKALDRASVFKMTWAYITK